MFLDSQPARPCPLPRPLPAPPTLPALRLGLPGGLQVCLLGCGVATGWGAVYNTAKVRERGNGGPGRGGVERGGGAVVGPYQLACGWPHRSRRPRSHGRAVRNAGMTLLCTCWGFMPGMRAHRLGARSRTHAWATLTTRCGLAAAHVRYTQGTFLPHFVQRSQHNGLTQRFFRVFTHTTL